MMVTANINGVEYKLTEKQTEEINELISRFRKENVERPYKNKKELLDDVQRRFGIRGTGFGHPYIWIKYKGENNPDMDVMIEGISDSQIRALGTWWSFDRAAEVFTFMDGSYFGIKGEQE